MGDNTFFSNSGLPSQTETLDVIVRGYTLRRKLAIGAWLAVLIALLTITYMCFALFNAGAELFVDIRIDLVQNVSFAPPHPYHTFIPLIDYARYPLFVLSIWCGIKTLIALFIPPPTRVHPVRVHTTRTGESRAM